jgi:hypothetical protein
MRRAFSALNGYQYEDAFNGQVKTPQFKAPFGRKAVPLLLGASQALSFAYMHVRAAQKACFAFSALEIIPYALSPTYDCKRRNTRSCYLRWAQVYFALLLSRKVGKCPLFLFRMNNGSVGRERKTIH